MAQKKIWRSKVDHEAVLTTLGLLLWVLRARQWLSNHWRAVNALIWPLDPQAFSSPSTQVFIY